MVAPRALVFRPLVEGNEDSGNEIGVNHALRDAQKLSALTKVEALTVRVWLPFLFGVDSKASGHIFCFNVIIAHLSVPSLTVINL